MKIPFYRHALNNLFLILMLGSFAGYTQSYTMATGTITTCSGTFYDNGGPSANYSNGVNYTETFISSTGNRIKFDFTTMTSLNAANLSIYDGPNASYPLIGSYSGSTFSVQSTGTALTFVFTSPSGSWSTYAGWEANISCTTPTLTPYTMTNGTVTACSGVFFDPAGPAADYANNTNMVQTFSSGSSAFINFDFTNFSTQIGDTLFAYDGTTTTSPLIGAYTSGKLPETISSLTGSSITFKFVSNASSISSGWKALINCTSTPNPGTVFIMQNGTRYVCSGTFYDNGGPTNNYTNGVNYTETFISSAGNRIKFDFTTMTSLNAANLSIYDGPNASYPLIGSYSGSTFSVQSTGTALTFVFTSPSGSWSTYAGWEASISCTTPTLTPYAMTNGTVTACSGVFFDPAGPAADYANTTNMVQTFSSGSSAFINFNFTNFNTQIGDTLFAYDGTTTTSPLIGAYTSGKLPETISSLTGSSITFKFVSNASSVSSGWKALINCTSTPNPGTVFIMQNGTRYVCSGTFYDNGGPTNNYTNGVNYTETFISSTGNRIKFDFTTMTSLNAANLSIYDGPNASYPLIGSYSGSTFSVQSTGTALTFVFNSPSGSWSTYAGWEANISCTSIPIAPVADFSTPSYTICSGSCINFSDESTNSPNAWNWQFQGASVATSTVQNPTNICYNTAGTYTVSLTASNTVGSSVSIQTITVLASPVLTITPASIAVCAGQSTTLTAVGANTYTWSTSANTTSISVTPASNTTYTVTGKNANGCAVTANKTVTVNPLPVININGSTSLCTGQSTTLTATGATTYTWSTTATTNSIVVTPASTTVYSVSGKNANGCVNTTSTSVTVGSSLALTITGNTLICTGQSATLTANGANTYTWSTTATTNSITASPTANAIYTVTGKNTGGCTGTASVSVNVNSLPTLTLTSSSATICAGQSVILTASGANTYTWSTTATTNSINVSPTGTTSYTVSGKNTNGCVASAVKSITVAALPVLNVSSSQTLICIGQQAILSVTGANTYTWSTAETTSSISISPAIPTTYTVIGTNTLGCSKSVSIVQNVSTCTGIETIGTKTSGKVYPNPFSNELILAYTSPVSVTIVNVLGETVYAYSFNSEYKTIDTSHFPAGIYYLEVTGSDRTVIKLVKQ